MDGLVLAAIGIGIAAPVAVATYYWTRFSRRCPKCRTYWTWKVTSSYDEPTSTFQERSLYGSQQSGDDKPRPIYRVTTYEVGMRTVDRTCSSCGHNVTTKGRYKKSISVNNEVR